MAVNYSEYTLIKRSHLQRNLGADALREADKYLFLASAAPCQICGKDPAGDDSIAVVHVPHDSPRGTVGGVCEGCFKQKLPKLPQPQMIDVIINAHTKRHQAEAPKKWWQMWK
jgi:hypothetical protein